MKITDIIRRVLDIVDLGDQEATNPQITGISMPCTGISPGERIPTTDLETELMVGIEGIPTDELAIIQQLAGLEPEVEPVGYANEPDIIVAPLEASFPAGDDMHHSKNPADIRTNAPSMYPGYQAEKP